MKYIKRLYNRLKFYRQKAHLTQTGLAEIVGCSKNTISSIETYKFYPGVHLALSLSIVLGCTVEDLFYF